MPLTIVSNCEEDDIIDPFCVDDGCIPKRELARVRSIANYRMGWFKTIFKPLLTAFSNAQTADPFVQADVDDAYADLLAAWQQGMTDKNVYVISETNGSFDGGTPIVGAGYGDQKERLIGYTFVLNGIDPLPGGNFAHWNTITKASNWGTAFRSETFTHFTEVATSKTFKQEIADDIAGERTIAVETKWDGEQPAPYADLVDLFKCSAAIPVVPGLAAPTSFQATQKTYNSFLLTWAGPAGAAFTIRRATNATITQNVVPFNTAAGATQRSQNGLDPNTVYYWDIVSTQTGQNNSAAATTNGETFDTRLNFDITVTPSAAGVQANLPNGSATDANKHFDFDAISGATGAGQTMAITIGGTQVLQVTYPAAYNGTPFAYFNSAGTIKTGVFTNGTVAF